MTAKPKGKKTTSKKPTPSGQIGKRLAKKFKGTTKGQLKLRSPAGESPAAAEGEAETVVELAPRKAQPLSESREERLARLEAIVDAGVQAALEAGLALIQIKEEALYVEAGCRSFEQYCRERRHISRQHAYRLIAYAETVETMIDLEKVSPAGDIDFKKLPERAVRELAPLVREDPEDAVERLSTLKERGLPLTSETIRDAVRQGTGPISIRGMTSSTARNAVSGFLNQVREFREEKLEEIAEWLPVDSGMVENLRAGAEQLRTTADALDRLAEKRETGA